MLPQPHGQVMLSGSMTRLIRGWCPGRARTFSRVTRDTRASFVRIGRTRRDLFFDRRDLRLRFGDGRLKIFQRRRVCGKGLHHLGWKVWKRVDIKGLRHADL
jgi:hypothetical protein